MNKDAIRKLVELNNSFYREHHESFSSTRKASWPGWERVCSHMRTGQDGYSILDAACGNMRFERYVIERFPLAQIDFVCIDSCPALAEPLESVAYQEVDIIDCLLDEESFSADGSKFDAAVSFGFMHHIPTKELRTRFMRSMLEMLVPGGLVAVSFWQFLKDEGLAERAAETTRTALKTLDVQLEEGDFLVGWNGQREVYRYCHSFTSEEVDELVVAVKDLGECIDRFESDGRNHALNGYAVLRRR